MFNKDEYYNLINLRFALRICFGYIFITSTFVMFRSFSVMLHTTILFCFGVHGEKKVTKLIVFKLTNNI
jgi:hypothetical protein